MSKELPKSYIGCRVRIKKGALPTDSAERKDYPLHRGLLAYFPAALAQVAHTSLVNNRKHNPTWDGTGPINHMRGSSGDHADCILRHLVDADERTGPERITELTALAWRSLALLQEELEAQGFRPAPAAKFKE